MRTLRACLIDEPLPRLMALADVWDAALDATSAQSVAESLSTHMLQGEALRAVIEGLPDGARAALTAVVAAGGKLPVAAFERRFGAIRPMGPGKLERERPWLAPANAAEVLWYRGLVFRAFEKAPGAPSEMIFVPSDMLPLVREDATEDAELAARPATPRAGDATVGDEDGRWSSLLDDVTTLLCHVQNHDVKVKASGEWDAASRRALAPMLRDADGVADANPNGRFAFLIHLIARLGWTRPANGRLRLISQPVAQWLQSAPPAQRDALYRAWLGDPDWNDLAHVDGLTLQMAHAWSNDPLRERQAIVEMWERFAPSAASGEDSDDSAAFVAHVKATDPDFARRDGRYDTWHVQDARSGDFLGGFENWDRVEGALIRHTLAKPMAWLLWEDMSAPAPVPPPFTVGVDGDIAVGAWLRFERFQLARVADWVETGAAIYRYALTARSLARAREQGIRPSRVAEFLDEAGGRPIPDGVKRALLRWGERGSEVRLEHMAVLKTPDGATMEALLRLAAVRRAVVDRFAPNCISIRARDVDEVRAAIVESGLMVEGG